MRGQKLSGEKKNWRETSGDEESSYDNCSIPSSSFVMTPAGQFFNGFFGDTMRSFDYPLHKVAPYWTEQPIMRECNVGTTLGEVVDDDEKFTLEMDVSEFHPNELSVDLNETERELIVEGNQESNEHDKDNTTTRRFKRYIDVPHDIRIDELASQITRNGKLKISAPKHGPDQPVIIRRIPIRFVPEDERQSSNRTSEVFGKTTPQYWPVDSGQRENIRSNPYELTIFQIQPHKNGS